MTLSSLQRAAVERFEDSFGAVFSFPPQANNATAHIKGANGVAQIYAGRWDTKTIGEFISSEIANVYEEVKAMMPGEDTLAAHDEWQRGWQAGWKEYREVMIKRLSDGV